MSDRPVIVIGAGPAGLAASLQLKRQGIEPLLIEKRVVGGLLNNAYLVENYPGFPDGISGHDLASKMYEQIIDWGIVIDHDSVTSVRYDGRRFQVITGKGMTHTARYMIIASGTVPKTLDKISMNVPSDRIFYDVISCEENTHKRFVIIGTGDAAFDYALNLSRNNTVTIIGRSNRCRSLDILYKRALASSHICIHLNTIIQEIQQKTDDTLCLKCQRDTETIHLTADFLIVAIGRKPCVDFFDQSIISTLSESRDKGILHLIGDVQNGQYRQTAIAVGDGIRAAMLIAEHIANDQDLQK